MSNYLKNATKAVLCAAYKYSGAASVLSKAAQRRGDASMAVLLFHRVTDEIPEDGLTVRPSRFRRICQMLKQQFNVVPLAEIHRIVNSRAPIPPRTLAITFDDTYKDNLAAAHVLAEYQLPATFFLTTSYVGTDKVYQWDERLNVRLPNLTWDDVDEIDALGHEIGSHTKTHPNIADIEIDKARYEMVDSRKILEDRLSKAVRWFAYPFGEEDHCCRDKLFLVEEAGYDACFSAYGGFIDRHFCDDILPREPVPYFRSVLNLELHLKGCLNWLYALKNKNKPS